MAKQCAYCGKSGKLTRDHVWPSCFLDRMGREAAHFSHKAQRVHGADYVVSDVCAKCNANRLSELDSYFCKLYDAYFVDVRDFNATVDFMYDYKTLSRALLKIAYNSARAAGSDVKELVRVRSYVLGLTDLPHPFALFLEVVSPSLVADANEPDGVRKVMPTGLYRSAIAMFLKPSGKNILLRVVAVNSFYFHLLLPRHDVSDVNFELAALEFANSISGIVRLTPDSGEAAVHTSPQHALSSLEPHLRAHADQYTKHFARNKT